MTDETPTPREVVLLVDDNADLLALMDRLLRDDGLHVIQAETAERALDVLAKVRVDVIVTDVVMEEMDGIELCRRVRENPAYRHVPVVFVTGKVSYDEISRLFDVGADDFIPKPFKPEEFTVRLRNIIRQTRRESALRKRASQLERKVEVVSDEVEVQRQFCTDVVSSLYAWLLVLDDQLQLRFANRAYCEARGVSAGELNGRPLWELLPQSMLEGTEVIDTVRRTLETGRSGRLPNVRFQGDDGDERAMDFRVNAITVGGRSHVLLVVLDVSERWWAAELLGREKRKMEDIVHGMGGALALLDRDLNVLWANKQFIDSFGAIQGERFDSALRGLDLGGKADPAEIFTEREYRSDAWAHYSPDGTKRFYRNVIVPTRDAAGKLKELVLVVQDLTELTLRAEQHQLLRELVDLTQTTLDRDRLLYIILTCATAGHALGFNRAFLFLTTDDGKSLRGALGVGPASREEAFSIWAELAAQKKSLPDLTAGYDALPASEHQPLTRVVRELDYPLEGEGAEQEIVARTAIEGRVQQVTDAWNDPRVTQAFRDRFGAKELVSVPLQAKGRTVGVLLADNLYSGRPLSSEQVEILELFAGPAGLAIENAQTYAELKLRMDELQNAQESLIQSERLATVGSLAAHIAHEIRNPLVTIGGFTRFILRDPDDTGKVRANAQIIYDEVQRLEGILAEVMDFTKPPRPHIELHGVNDMVRRVLETLDQQLREQDIELQADYAADLPAIPLDEKQIFQVLLNLLKNGVESMAEVHGEVHARRLSVRTGLMDSAVRVEIADTGEGIAPEMISRLFEPFFSTKPGGTGLGLAVTRKIVLDHGGKITVQSERGVGSTFTLTLPVEAASPPHLEAEENRSLEQLGVPSYDTSRDEAPGLGRAPGKPDAPKKAAT